MSTSVATLLSLLTSVLLTPLLRKLGKQAGILDVPNERSSHTAPTPRSGGVAIVAAILVTWLCLPGRSEWPVVVFFAAVGIIALTGFVDDVRSISAGSRLTIQIIAAAIVVFVSNWSIDAASWHFRHVAFLSICAMAISVFWIVAVTNAFNFMDGINGISSAQAIIHFTTLAWLSAATADGTGAAIAAGAAAAALGFIPWNLPSGSIFMGDVGSASLGFVLASLILRLGSNSPSLLIAAALPLMPFLLDTGGTLLRRARNRESVFSAHRTHHYQLLNRSGWSHAQVSALWSVMSLACALVSINFQSLTTFGKVAMMLLLLAGHVLVFRWVRARFDRASVT